MCDESDDKKTLKYHNVESNRRIGLSKLQNCAKKLSASNFNVPISYTAILVHLIKPL